MADPMRRARAPGWPRSDQPWRAFQRGFRLLRTNTLRPRRTTTDPAFCFNALSEFLAFIVRRPFGRPACFCRLLKGQPFSSRQNSGLTETRAISHAAANWNGAAGCRRAGCRWSRSSTAPVTAHAAGTRVLVRGGAHVQESRYVL